MRWYNGLMSVLTILCVAIVLLVLMGCAGVDQHQYELDKAESNYRKSLGKSNDSKYNSVGSGPIEMPKEWMEQWPSLREDKQVDQ